MCVRARMPFEVMDLAFQCVLLFVVIVLVEFGAAICVWFHVVLVMRKCPPINVLLFR